MDVCYSVNLLNGAVLRNGKAPSRLPLNMVSHELYKRTFGGATFEVTDDLVTRQPALGRNYQFQLAGGRLVVRESEALADGEEETLELLPGAAHCQFRGAGHAG